MGRNNLIDMLVQSKNFISGNIINSVYNLRRSKKLMTVYVVSKTEKNKSAISRNNLSEKKRLMNRARKSVISARFKKVISAISAFTVQHGSTEKEFKSVDELISKLYMEIDKAVVT